MPGTRKAKLVAKETIANVQQPSTRRRDASQTCRSFELFVIQFVEISSKVLK